MIEPKPTHFTLAVSRGLNQWSVDQTFATEKLARSRIMPCERELMDVGEDHWRYYALIPSDGSPQAISAGLERLKADCTICHSVAAEFDIFGKNERHRSAEFRAQYKAFIVDPWFLGSAAAGDSHYSRRRVRVERAGKFAFDLEAPVKTTDLEMMVDIYDYGHHDGYRAGSEAAFDAIRESRNAAA